MAVDVKKSYAAGAVSVYYAVRDSSGYMVGSTATAPTAGTQTASGMAQLEGIKNWPLQPQETERVYVTGDNGALGSFLFKPVQMPSGEVTFGAHDMDFAAVAMRQVVHNLGGGQFFGIQGENISYEDLMFLAFSDAKSLTTGSRHSSMYYCNLVLNAQAFYRGRDAFNERAEASFVYSLTANKSSVYPWGLAFSDANNGDTEFVILEFTWPYKPYMDRWTGNNTETTFNLTKNIALDSDDNIIAYVNGVAQTWVTGAPGAGEFGITEGATDTIVFGTAPANNAKVVALYGWS